MSRLFTSGFELQSTTSGVEIGTISTSGTGSVTINTNASYIRSGLSSLKTSCPAANDGVNVYDTVSAITVAYLRVYFYIYSLSTDTPFGFLKIGGSSGPDAGISFDNTDKKLYVTYYNASGTLISLTAQKSAALNTGQWYCVELFIDRTSITNVTLTARLDGTQFSNSTGLSTYNETYNRIYSINYGDAVGGTVIYVDDVAFNNNTGSYQNSWPGSGKVIRLKPNAAGDDNQWLNHSGGAGGANDYQEVYETTPDTTTFIECKDATTNKEDLFNVTDSGIGASDTVNVVHVGVRYNGAGSSANSSFKVEVEKAASGTKGQSAAITPNGTTWHTNANAAPYTYPITEYLDPDNSVAWTQSTLDSMQIGVLCTTASTNYAKVSTLWAMVDYTPNGATYTLTASAGSLALTGESQVFNKFLNLTAAYGSLVLTGISTALHHAMTMALSYGSFTLTGISANFYKYWKLTPTYGSLALTGIAQSFNKYLHLTPSYGSFTLSGISQSFGRLYTLTCSYGSLVLTGISANFYKYLHLTPSYGSFTLTGISQTLHRVVNASLSYGSFAFTGIAQALHHAITASLSYGSFTLTGIAQDFKKYWNLTAAYGNFTLTGIAQTFYKYLNLVAGYGSFTLTGISQALHRAVVAALSAGSFTLTGVSQAFHKVMTAALSAGSFILTGISTVFSYIPGSKNVYTLVASAGSFVLTGISASFNKYWKLLASYGSFTLTGVSQVLHRVKMASLAGGVFALTGFTVAFKKYWNLACGTGYFKSFKNIFIVNKGKPGVEVQDDKYLEL